MGLSQQIKTTSFLVIIVLVLWVAGYTYDFRTHARIYFLDVGQADATLIHIPDGTQMLVDCGKDTRGLEALQRKQSYFDRTIEYLVITHADLDHFGGCIPILNTYTIEQVVYNGLDKAGDPRWEAMWEVIKEEGSEVVVVEQPMTWKLGELTIRSVFPNYPITQTPEFLGNNASVVLRIDSPEGSYLLTGDAEKEEEEFMLENMPGLLDVDVLKAGHHGSKTSSTEAFVSVVSPHTTVVSAGIGNRYGHPHGRVLARYKRHGVNILQTSMEGDISFMLY